MTTNCEKTSLFTQTENSKPSDWVVRFSPLIKKKGCVLDLACGNGRHTRYLLKQGFYVVAIDKNTSCLKDLKKQTDCMVIKADIETKKSIFETKILSGYIFDSIIVINYLHRPLFSNFFNALAPGGLIIYETFAEGNECFGRPKNPEYLLKNNELINFTHTNFNIIAYEHGIIEKNTSSSVIQRICAIKQLRQKEPDEKTVKKIYP